MSKGQCRREGNRKDCIERMWHFFRLLAKLTVIDSLGCRDKEVALRVTSEPFYSIYLLSCVLFHGIHNLWQADTNCRFLGSEWVDNADILLVSGLLVIIVIVVGDPELLVPVHVADDSHGDQEGSYHCLGQHAEGDLHPGLSIYVLDQEYLIWCCFFEISNTFFLNFLYLDF